MSRRDPRADEAVARKLVASAHEALELRLSLPKRRICAAVVFITGCSAEEADECLMQAMAAHSRKYPSDWMITDESNLGVWLDRALFAYDRVERSRHDAKVIQFFPGRLP